MLSEFVMDYTMNGRLWEHMSNEHWFLAPHNVYRCAGEDRWVTIAVRSDEEWQALCAAMHREDLASDPRFSGQARRWEHRRELDPLISEWTVTREPYWVAERLLSFGVPSGVVMNARDVLNDPQHLDREFFQEIEYSETGRQRYVGPAWRADGTERVQLAPPPMLGGHNEYVYREILGYSESEFQRFVELHHAGTEYEPDVP
jgi:benzylsuccinate CoA-transferase BbsF subunit